MMTSYRDLFVTAATSVEEAMRVLDRTARGVLLVVDTDERLINTVTDGDLRRAILAGRPLSDSLEFLIEEKSARGQTAVTAPADAPPEELKALMVRHVVRQIPLMDAAGKIAGLVTFNDLLSDRPQTEAVIMAGGFGKRLYPLTAETPKPMLHVGDRPLLQHTIESLRDSGIADVNITTHFAAEKIRDHFGDGTNFGVNVNYVAEDKPLGTAGALTMLRHKKNRFLVVNGDILTGVDFRALGHFHDEHGAELTVCVRQYDYVVPYGVMECEKEFVTAVHEKPRYEFFVNAGIYLVEPSALDFIPPDTAFHMTDLINAMVKAGRKVACFPIVEYWLDIGQPADFAQAQKDIQEGKIKS